MIDVVQFDTAVTLRLTIKDASGVVVNLTGATVKLLFYIDNYPPHQERTMTVTAPTTGVATYQFGFSNNVYDLATPGILRYRTQVTFNDGTILTSPNEGLLNVIPAYD